MKIGLIAGSGDFPLMFARRAAEKGYQVYAVAYKNAADAALEADVHTIEWCHVGELERLLAFFAANDIRETVIMGGVTKTVNLSDIKVDKTAISMISGLTETHDDALLRCFADFLETRGITVRASTFLLPEILARHGCWTKRPPTPAEEKDIVLGWRIAKAVGRLDVGQCVVVEAGTILAVEAIDGTDATIQRGGKLSAGNAAVVKVCKPQQDMRFDIPAVGLTTIESMRAANIPVLAVEADRAVVFDRAEMVAVADRYNMCIVALKDQE
ncbi:MAG: UDP-2,3-diacylglucosamine diphosphatase LpxI [Thermodesulfobacteriota bacterium]|nr:UDP-2,3-diacylglucosamine diphosphatase LpxI [Thermodesulfobacteriota bacterium]